MTMIAAVAMTLGACTPDDAVTTPDATDEVLHENPMEPSTPTVDASEANATTARNDATVANEKLTADPFDDVSNQHLWIIKSKDSIEARLKDAESAKFRDVRFYSGGPVPVVCGEVNAKNSLGGYSGYERFIASGDNVKIAFLASDVADGDSINIAWKELCITAERDEAYVR